MEIVTRIWKMQCLVKIDQVSHKENQTLCNQMIQIKSIEQIDLHHLRKIDHLRSQVGKTIGIVIVKRVKRRIKIKGGKVVERNLRKNEIGIEKPINM